MTKTVKAMLRVELGTLCQTLDLPPAVLSRYTGETATRRSTLALTPTPDRAFISSSLTILTLCGDQKTFTTECITPDKVTSLDVCTFKSVSVKSPRVAKPKISLRLAALIKLISSSE